MNTDDRTQVFDRIRAALTQRPNRTPRPEIDPAQLVATRRLAGDDLWEAFARNLASVRGNLCRSITEVVELLQQQGAKRGYCDPALRSVVGDPLAAHFDIVNAFPREDVDTIDFGSRPPAG